ncbi:MAG: hypothetical protein KDJ31_07955 [Candidatus Competibacteraceae bacterium]|nr:hypothetical protein [Candidatus Competibacteraceae bacterium]
MNSLKILLPEITVWKEDRMQTPEAIAAMRRLHQLGWGIQRIAHELGCSKNTVKGHLRPAGGGCQASSEVGDGYFVESFRNGEGVIFTGSWR